MSQVKVAINGFGRIGRTLLREGFQKLDFVAINNKGGTPETLAHLLKYDSTHGTYSNHVESGADFISVNDKKIPITNRLDPAELNWGELGVDVVFECTGVFKARAAAQKHIDAGAKKVIISAPAPESDLTVVYGVNSKNYKPEKHHVISNASCTTNCLAPLAHVLHNEFGIERGMMTTVHSYTSDQRILDSNHKDLRRARAAALSMVPTTTGAAKAVGVVLPELAGKIDGMAIRVPTPNVSLVDFTVEVQKQATAEIINKALIEASNTYLKGVLATEARPLVSRDFNSHPASSIIDLQSTYVLQENLVKVLSWYDNEVGFSNRMIDLASLMYEAGL